MKKFQNVEKDAASILPVAGADHFIVGAGIALQWGKRVLVVDWDLEAPGLEHYFGTFIDTAVVADRPGVLDLLLTATKDGIDASLEPWRLAPVAIPVSSKTRFAASHRIWKAGPRVFFTIALSGRRLAVYGRTRRRCIGASSVSVERELRLHSVGQ